MTSDATGLEFRYVYVRTLRDLGIEYQDTEFLYPHDPPWPQESFDYPYGMAPPIDQIPAAEQRDWQQHVANYYRAIALNLDKSPSTNDLVGFLETNLEKNTLRGYADLPDTLFLELLCEGLYSKFLSSLDGRDKTLFKIAADDGYQYLKCDLSCMRVVEKTWPGEHVAPTIAVVRRKIDPANPFKYELFGIAITTQGGDLYGAGKDVQVLKPVPQTDPTWNTWRLAKYFVLQGAIHRMNLIDHVKVHFPHDVINAVTKAVLPEWHLLQQLLLPHFWLTLPVNDAVLEGPRSLINRDTWYPWSPFAAKGDEIRKLLPFSWAGYQYYFSEVNQSFPAFVFTADPKQVPDPAQPGKFIPTFIGLDVSEYARFQSAYWQPILDFVRAVVKHLGLPPTNPAMHGDLAWLEVQHWAHEISKFLPGFPDWREICSVETLARTVAIVIWNAAVVHSADHSTLHTMVADPTKPVPFILRVTPEQQAESIGTLVGATGQKVLKDLLGEVVAGVVETVVLPVDMLPLCQPTDVVWAQMTDLLFYRPHNATTLYDTDYPFTSEDAVKKMKEKWKNRPMLTADDVKRLKKAWGDCRTSLVAVDNRFFGPGVRTPASIYGFPRLTPPIGTPDPEKFKVTNCIGAGIQY